MEDWVITQNLKSYLYFYKKISIETAIFMTAQHEKLQSFKFIKLFPSF